MKQLSCTPKKRGGKKLAAFGLTAAVLGGALLVVPGAQAASNVSPVYWGSEYGYTLEVNTEWNDREHGGESDAPAGQATNWVGAVATRGYTNGAEAPRGYTWCIQWSKDANGSELQNPSGTSEITGEKARVANIIAAKHAANGNNHPEIALAMHELFDTNSRDGRGGVNAWTFEKQHNRDATFRSLLSTSMDWIDSAEKYAKPYSIQPEFNFGNEPVKPGSTGTITNLNVMSGNTSLGQGTSSVGNQIRITVELHGGIEFASGHKTKQTFNPGETPQVRVVDAGMIGATVETNDSLPSDAVTKIEFDEYQDRVTHQGPTSIEGAIPEMQVKYMPSVTTETSQARAEPGAELYDKITVEGVPDDEEVTVSSTLYYHGDDRPERQPNVPDHAEPVGTVETVVQGSGTYDTPTVTIDKPGYYTWVETIEGTETMEPWTSDYGISEETSIIPWSPKVTTKVSEQRAEPGAEIFDTLIISDNKDGKELTVNSTLYGPFDHREEQGTELPEDAPVVGSVETVITGNGEFQTDPLVVEDRGYYFWVETIEETDETESWGYEEDESPTWQEEETTVVPWEIKSSTDISDRSSHEGGSVHPRNEAPHRPANVIGVSKGTNHRTLTRHESYDPGTARPTEQPR